MIDKLENKAETPKERSVHALAADLRGGRCPNCGGPLHGEISKESDGETHAMKATVWCTNCNYRTAADAKIHG